MEYNKGLFAQLESGKGHEQIREEYVTNPYMNWYAKGESQQLQDILVSQAIQVSGIECFYMQRDIVDLDRFFGEPRESRFRHARKIGVYPDDFQGYQGQQDFFGKHGYTVQDEFTFSVNPRTFSIQANIALPREGDLIFFPMTNGIFEIKWVEEEKPFYPLGMKPLIQITAERFTYSGEEIDVQPYSGEDASNFDISDIEALEPINNINGLQDTNLEEFAEVDQIKDEAKEFVEDVEQVIGEGVIETDEDNPFDEEL